jgi:hypothetical protein
VEERLYHFGGSCYHHLQGRSEKYTLMMGTVGFSETVVPSTWLHSITSRKIIILSFLVFKSDLFYGATEYKECFSTSFNWSCLMSLISSGSQLYKSFFC